MKKFLCVLILPLCSLHLFAQRDFEGYIVYEGYDSLSAAYDIDRDTLKVSRQVVKIWFSPGRMRVESVGERKDKAEVMIIALDSGIAYSINDEERNYSVEKLSKRLILPAASPEQIAGAYATPITGDCSLPGTEGKSVIWYAQPLFHCTAAI